MSHLAQATDLLGDDCEALEVQRSLGTRYWKACWLLKVNSVGNFSAPLTQWGTLQQGRSSPWLKSFFSEASVGIHSLISTFIQGTNRFSLLLPFYRALITNSDYSAIKFPILSEAVPYLYPSWWERMRHISRGQKLVTLLNALTLWHCRKKYTELLLTFLVILVSNNANEFTWQQGLACSVQSFPSNTSSVS